MALIRDTAFPLANYAAGTRSLPSSIVPDAARAISLSIRRCTTADPTIWPLDTVSVSVMLETSVDGGQSWRPLAGYTAQGGIADNKGVEAPESSFYVDLPQGTARRIRGTVTISGGVLRSEAFVDVVTE